MDSYSLNDLPNQVKNGKITKKEAVNIISSFICTNYKAFNLQKYDEDFRSDLVMVILERGEKLLDTYNPELGDFFTYLYSYILSQAHTKIRSLTHKKMIENVTLSESANFISEKEYKYKNIKNYYLSEKIVPYAPNTASKEELKKIFNDLRTDSTDKKILILAMKSSFYLSDAQILKVCKIYNLKAEDFYMTIQYFKHSIEKKIEKRNKQEESRNYSYYHHKKYLNEMSKIEQSNDESEIDKSLKKNQISSKEIKHYKNWKRLNKKFSEGYMILRPTTKTIADILGICERQVNYYITSAKKEEDDKDKN